MSTILTATAPSPVPARARRVGDVPAPRVRPLAEVLPAPPRAAVPAAAPDLDPRRDQDDLDRLAATLRPVAARLLGAVADVLAGRRPPGHLDALLSGPALQTLARAARPSAARGGATVRAPASGPAAANLRGLRVCALGPRAVEVSAVVHGRDRVRALAARLERADDGPADPGRWRVVALCPG
ncbi:Rv3235 family protein [Actinomycetospora sp. C-140]